MAESRQCFRDCKIYRCAKTITRDTIEVLPWKWSDVIISGVNTEQNQQAVQLNLEEVADIRGVAPVDAMFDL